jgi:hypothetical protein
LVGYEAKKYGVKMNGKICFEESLGREKELDMTETILVRNVKYYSIKAGMPVVLRKVKHIKRSEGGNSFGSGTERGIYRFRSGGVVVDPQLISGIGDRVPFRG